MGGGGSPTGLGALFRKLGLILPHKKPGAPGDLRPRSAAPAKPPRGARLGDHGALRVGHGYGGEDLRTSRKNANERAHVDKFLREMPGGGRRRLGAHEATPRTADAAGEGETPLADLEAERLNLAARRDEARAETQMFARGDIADDGDRPVLDFDPDGRERRQSSDQDDEDRPGAGWIAEELEGEEEDERRRGLRTVDTLDEPGRCRHGLPDGERCLRRAIEGTPYCRAHAASVPHDPTFTRE